MKRAILRKRRYGQFPQAIHKGRQEIHGEKAHDDDLFIDNIEGPVKVEEQDGTGAP